MYRNLIKLLLSVLIVCCLVGIASQVMAKDYPVCTRQQ